MGPKLYNQAEIILELEICQFRHFILNLLTRDALCRQLVHLGAGGDHLHREGVHHHHPLLHPPRGLVVASHRGPDHIVHKLVK